MSPSDWNNHVDFFLREDRVHNSIVNTRNRRKQKYASTHGTKALVEYRHDRHLADGKYPSLVEGFGIHHKQKGIYVNRAAEKDHALMLELERAQQDKESAKRMSDAQILEEVLGTRRGHNRGRGRILRGSQPCDLLPEQSQAPGTRVYTQADVDKIIEGQQSQISTLRSQQETMFRAMNSQGISISFPSIQIPQNPQNPQIPSSSGSHSMQLGDDDEVHEEEEGSDENEDSDEDGQEYEDDDEEV